MHFYFCNYFLFFPSCLLEKELTNINSINNSIYTDAGD